MKSRGRMSGIVFLAVSLSLTMGGGAHPPLAADGCEYPDGFVFVMGTDSYAPPKIPMPPKGTCITDPNFHTLIGRVTDKKSGS